VEIVRIFFLLFSLFSFLFANDIAMLLNKIENKEDLSRKTRMESFGISYIITRYQLDMMQAKTLADVLKNTIIGYSESRFAIADPWHVNFIPYNSFGVRVFIDNQEIDTGKYDNALFLLSKINLSYVDHIEIYYMNPTYSLTNEPAYVIIKIYTKNAKRDEGLRVEGDYGTYKTNIEAIDYAKPGKWNIFTHFSNTDLNHPVYHIKDSTVKRNSKAKHFLLSVYNGNTRILLTGIDYKQDAFLGLSLDGNIKQSLITSKLLHLGIDTKRDNLSFLYSVDYVKNSSDFVENDNGILFINPYNYRVISSVHTKDYSLINTLKGVYKFTKNNHSFIVGATYRNKKMDYTQIEINGANQPYNGEKQENIYTGFLEDNYQFLKNSVFTIGFSGSKYFSDTQNNIFLKQAKIGDTFLFSKNDVLKLFYYHMEFLSGSYLDATLIHTSEQKPRKTDALLIKYKKKIKDSTFEITGINSRVKNLIFMTQNGLEYDDSYVPIKILDLRYHLNYCYVNDLIMEYINMYFKKISLERFQKFIFLNTHRYKNFEFFENFIFTKAHYIQSEKYGKNLSLGIKYNVNDNLTLALKGENLLNKGYSYDYPLIDVLSQKYTALSVPVTERSVLFSLEYTF
jgi:iron complex outermembrane receptor protein